MLPKMKHSTFSQIPGGTITGIRSLQHGCLFQTTGLEILHFSMSNEDLSINYAVLGIGLDTDRHYGEQSPLAKRNLAELLNPSPISEDGKRHETAVGQLGEANFVVFYDPNQTLRTFVDTTTICADKDGAYSTCEIIPEADVKAKSAYIAREAPLFILRKLQSGRDPAVGSERPITGDAHFTKHSLSSNALSLDWTRDPSSAKVFR